MQKNEILVLLEAFLIEHKESDSSMKEFNIEISKFSNEYFSEKTKEIFQKKIEDLQKKLPK